MVSYVRHAHPYGTILCKDHTIMHASQERVYGRRPPSPHGACAVGVPGSCVVNLLPVRAQWDPENISLSVYPTNKQNKWYGDVILNDKND